MLKPPAVRRAELIDCAQTLFLSRGYERTTINDVISATGLSKGAFYHHFRAKEDLLEAIAGRAAQEALVFSAALEADPRLDALQRLNRLLALGREWKREHIGELKAMFETLLRPQNALLYHRIVEATFTVMAPALATIIAQGQAEGVFAAGDPRAMADALLWLNNGRRPIVMEALALAERDLDGAVTRIVERVRAEEAIMDRVLGLPAGGVEVLGSPDELRGLLQAWANAPRPISPG